MISKPRPSGFQTGECSEQDINISIDSALTDINEIGTQRPLMTAIGLDQRCGAHAHGTLSEWVVGLILTLRSFVSRCSMCCSLLCSQLSVDLLVQLRQLGVRFRIDRDGRQSLASLRHSQSKATHGNDSDNLGDEVHVVAITARRPEAVAIFQLEYWEQAAGERRRGGADAKAKSRKRKREQSETLRSPPLSPSLDSQPPLLAVADAKRQLYCPKGIWNYEFTYFQAAQYFDQPWNACLGMMQRYFNECRERMLPQRTRQGTPIVGLSLAKGAGRKDKDASETDSDSESQDLDALDTGSESETDRDLKNTSSRASSRAKKSKSTRSSADRASPLKTPSVTATKRRLEQRIEQYMQEVTSACQSTPSECESEAETASVVIEAPKKQLQPRVQAPAARSTRSATKVIEKPGVRANNVERSSSTNRTVNNSDLSLAPVAATRAMSTKRASTTLTIKQSLAGAALRANDHTRDSDTLNPRSHSVNRVSKKSSQTQQETPVPGSLSTASSLTASLTTSASTACQRSVCPAKARSVAILVAVEDISRDSSWSISTGSTPTAARSLLSLSQSSLSFSPLLLSPPVAPPSLSLLTVTSHNPTVQPLLVGRVPRLVPIVRANTEETDSEVNYDLELDPPLDLDAPDNRTK